MLLLLMDAFATQRCPYRTDPDILIGGEANSEIEKVVSATGHLDARKPENGKAEELHKMLKLGGITIPRSEFANNRFAELP